MISGAALSQSTFYTRFTVISLCLILTVFMLSKGGQLTAGRAGDYPRDRQQQQIKPVWDNGLDNPLSLEKDEEDQGSSEPAAGVYVFDGTTGEKDVFTDPDKLA